MAMDDILFGPEIWGEDTIHSHTWYILPGTTAPNYDNLKIYQKHDTWEYLRMLIKLLPLGYIWNFPMGEESDY